MNNTFFKPILIILSCYIYGKKNPQQYNYVGYFMRLILRVARNTGYSKCKQMKQSAVNCPLYQLRMTID